MRRDHLLGWDVAPPTRHAQEAREEGRSLDPREAASATRGVADDDREIQRQVGDVREGMSRIDRQGCQHRIHALVEDLPQLLTLRLLQVLPVQDLDSSLLEQRA